MLRFHTQTAGVQLTAQQPEVNLVRVALQGLGAVLGGTQSLHTNSYDEAIALPTAKAARLALRTQQVIAYETDVTKTVDPFAGSYVVESLTDDLEAAARASDAGRRGPRRSGRRDRAGFPEGRDRAVRLPDRPGDRHRRAGRRRRQPLHRSTSESRTSRCGSTRRSRPTSGRRWRACANAGTPASSSGLSTSCGRRPRAAQRPRPDARGTRGGGDRRRGVPRPAGGLGHLPPARPLLTRYATIKENLEIMTCHDP